MTQHSLRSRFEEKRSAAVLCFTFGTFGLALFGQPTPTHSTPADVITLHKSTHLVVLDVSVFDRSGSPVTDLSKNAFHLFEDGHEQTIKTLEEHQPVDPKAAQKGLAAVSAALPPNTYTNLNPFHASGIDVIVFDSLTGWGGNKLDRQDLIDYVKTVPGRSFVIFRLDTELHLIVGLTADTDKIVAALSAESSPSRPPDTTTFPQNRQIVANALDQITTYLAPVPGRKTMIWYSLGIGHYLSSEGFTVPADDWQPDREEVDLFCRWTDTLQQNRIDVYRASRESVSSGLGCRAGRVIGKTIGSVFNASAYYYTLSYTPTNDNWDGKYRKLKVGVETRGTPWKGVGLDYRDGYYGRPDDRSVERSVVSATPSSESPALVRALDFNSFGFDGVIFTATTTLSSLITKDTADAAPPSGNYLSAELRAQGYRDLTVRFAVHANQLGLILSPDHSSFAEQLQVVAVVYDSTGREINSKKSTVSATFDGPNDPHLDTASITADVDTQIPTAQGRYFLHIGVRDGATDHVGSLEIPLQSSEVVRSSQR